MLVSAGKRVIFAAENAGKRSVPRTSSKVARKTTGSDLRRGIASFASSSVRTTPLMTQKSVRNISACKEGLKLGVTP